MISFSTQARACLPRVFGGARATAGANNMRRRMESPIRMSTIWRTRFSVRQFDNSSDPNCYDIKFNIVFWINQAVCPVMTGTIAGPVSTQSQPDRITGRPGRVTDCPGGMDFCLGFYLSP